MTLFVSYLRLIRVFNLLIILFTLYTVRFFFILPIVGFAYSSLSVSEVTYALFSLSFVFVAAAGYIINDYCDVEIDSINKPGSVIIGKAIPASLALRLYWILNALGIFAGFWSCYQAGFYQMGFLFLFYIVALWFYSYRLKPTFLYGNLIVSICLALVPLAGIYVQSHAPAVDDNIGLVHYYAWGMAVFAFLSSLIRETVKDMQDVEGDSAAGCRTMAIVMGVKKTKMVILLLVLVMMVLLGLFEIVLGKEQNSAAIIYCTVCIQLPCLFVIKKIGTASSTKDYKRISAWLKLIMITGISYFFVFASELWILVQFFKSYTK